MCYNTITARDEPADNGEKKMTKELEDHVARNSGETVPEVEARLQKEAKAGRITLENGQSVLDADAGIDPEYYNQPSAAEVNKYADRGGRL